VTGVFHGGAVNGGFGKGIEAFPTAQPSLGFIGPVNGGPKEMDVKLLIVGLVTVP
jgi:hypothetical protein